MSLLFTAAPLSALSDPKQGRLLLVDDDPLVTASLQTLLLLQTTHEVRCFNNPQEALAALETYHPDVIISDFNMPHLTGIEFLKAAKALQPNVVGILLTGYSDKESALKSINEVELYRYLEKPWDNQQLLQTIETALQRVQLQAALQQTLTALANSNTRLEALVQQRTHALQVAHKELDAIIRHSVDGVLRLSDEGRIRHLNPVMAGWLRHTTAGRHCESFLQQPLATFLSLPNAEAESVQHGDWVQLQVEGLWLEGRCSLLSDAEAASDCVWVFRDISERKQLDRLRDDFMATLTHDLRTPLQAALQTFGFFQQGVLGAITPQQAEVLAVLHQSHKDMLGLVNTLLDVYRYEAGRYPLVMGEVATAALVEGVLQELHPLALERSQTLINTSPLPASQGVATLWGDRQELKRVLGNLLSNAIRHTPKGGQLQLWQGSVAQLLESKTPLAERLLHQMPQLQQHPSAWLACVSDNGQGIPLADQPQLFHRFSQGTTKKRSSGSGLGLYLSHHIVQQHGGFLGCYSRCVAEAEASGHHGSDFFFCIP